MPWNQPLAKKARSGDLGWFCGGAQPASGVWRCFQNPRCERCVRQIESEVVQGGLKGRRHLCAQHVKEHGALVHDTNGNRGEGTRRAAGPMARHLHTSGANGEFVDGAEARFLPAFCSA